MEAQQCNLHATEVLQPELCTMQLAIFKAGDLSCTPDDSVSCAISKHDYWSHVPVHGCQDQHKQWSALLDVQPDNCS